MAVVVAKGSAAGIMKPATSEARRLQIRPRVYYCPRLARGWATGAPAELADGPLRRRDHGHDYAARQATTNCHRTSPACKGQGREAQDERSGARQHHQPQAQAETVHADEERRSARRRACSPTPLEKPQKGEASLADKVQSCPSSCSNTQPGKAQCGQFSFRRSTWRFFLLGRT